MTTYLEWNEAIAHYFARGLMPGDTYYLSVDEDALVDISEIYFEQNKQPDAVYDFTLAVRDECVVGGRVKLPPTTPQRSYGGPACLAFLGATVLAANRMAPEDDIAEINYFTRLREILGIAGERGRPPGLIAPNAPEENLWMALNAWILRNGWRPSAERGPDGPMKFTNYPLSQSLLRKGDKEKLERDFRNAEKDLGKDADRERVSAWFFNRATDFSTHHIRRLAQDAIADRYGAIVDAVYNVYASIDWKYDESFGVMRSSRRLMAGLYREFNPLSGEITYYLFPRRQYKDIKNNLSVVRNSEPMPLHQKQDGQFRPLWPIDPKGGETYKVIGDPRVTELYVPSRNFWILTREQHDDFAGTLASRGAPRVGQTFLLLCREEFQEQLNILKDEGLMDWDGDPLDVPEYSGWMEYRECMILSASWSGIIPLNPELFDELRPNSRASISLVGGLKTGERDNWLEGYLPDLFITSFDRTCRVSVTNVSERGLEPVLDETVRTETWIKLPDLVTGDYFVQVLNTSGHPIDRRYIRVISWDVLQPNKSAVAIGTEVGNQILRGGLLVTDQDVKGMIDSEYG